MNTYSLRQNPFKFLLIGIFVLFNACQKEPEVVALDEQPQILAMTIPGIPQQNISIDQQTYTITVLLPSTLSTLEMIPTFTVSQQANINGDWGTGKKAISLKSYCPCRWIESKGVDDIEGIRVDNLTHTSYYKITFKNMGSLQVKAIKTPIVYDLISDPDIFIAVENYYGSSYVQYIAVTQTGSLSPNWLGPFCFDLCAGRLNELGIRISGYKDTGTLKPGLYDLDLRLVNGTTLHATGYILVK